MNREIKFRGKRLDNDEWVYGSLIHNYHEGVHKYYITENGMGQIYVHAKEVYPETVGQFTNVYDRDNTAIFTGDKLEDLNGSVGFVYYDKEFASYCVMIDENDPEDGVQLLSHPDMEEGFYKVIGTKYDE